MEIEFGAATDTGKVKKNNEDAYICDPELQLFIIADGMGGYAAGDVAAKPRSILSDRRSLHRQKSCSS